jgi:hypothetical protein
MSILVFLLIVVLNSWWLAPLTGEWLIKPFLELVRQHREHTLDRKRLELRIAQASGEPGLCAHTIAVPVRDNAGNLVVWLCPACDTQLPRSSSVCEEDL